MIPLRLHMHNFLSYGDSGEPIEFDGVRVGCLCGPNGHGKSAMLDGITWALWGQARTNTADDLVRLGQSSMFVEFDFLLEGQHYRIVRKRSKGRNSQSDLQFQCRSEDGEWRALTGQGVRGTQDRINQALRMDYDTFINSAFILQGRADEFARKTPRDRKQILGEILNLSVYDRLAEGARGHRGEAQMRVNSLEAQIVHWEREYAQLPECRDRVERLTAQETEARVIAEKARADLQEVITEKTRLDEIRKRRDDLDRRLAAADTRLRADRDQLGAVRARVKACRALMERAKEIRARSQEYAAILAEQQDLMARLLQLNTLSDEKSLLERRLQEERGRLETRLQLAERDARDLRARADRLAEMQRELADLERQAAALDRLEGDCTTLQTRLQEISAARAEAGAEQRRCSDDLEKAEERFRLLKGACAICPLCEGELTEEKRKELGWKLRDEKTALKEAHGRALQREADARKADAETQKLLRDLEAKLKTGQLMRDRLAQARQSHLGAEEAAKDLPKHVEIIDTLAASLKAADFAPEITRALADLEGRIRALNYDRSRQEALQRRAGELAGVERELAAMERAEADLPEQERQAETHEASIRVQEEAIAEDRAACAQAEQDLARAPDVESRYQALRQRLTLAEQALAQIAQQLGAARQLLERCEGLAEQIAGRKQERAAAAKDQAAYEELTKAFGKNGIQALIIENALPEIETEANNLLARMSDGQLHVRLETQKELRSGGQAETLDIRISDGMGERRYELYSGGEAFRVNFALRIALSKLLARRAGARLETLVIDEGFGSQDQEGRMRLVEAIQAIQDDFARILVITHLEDMKEAFPTRLEVTKGPNGSQVAVY
jgi:DNA repair protein SbcC/Rad50